MASSQRARALCRRQAAAAAAARSIETLTLHFGGPEVARGLERNQPARGNQASDSCSRAWSVSPGSAPYPSLSPRCQSQDCLNAMCGAAAEVVAQVETGHAEPGGKTQSSGRGPSLARQLGSGHAHAATQRWTAARVVSPRDLEQRDRIQEAQTVWGPFALEGFG